MVMAFRVIIFTALGFLLLGVLILVSLPKPNILVSADIRTETVETVVSNPSEAEFILPKAILLTSDHNSCLTNVRIRPGQDATVVFTQELSGNWFAAVEGDLSWTDDNGPANTGVDGAVFLVSPAEGECTWTGRMRLPLAGSLAAGILVAGNQEAAEGLLPILEGRLTVYGRATERVLWFVPLAAFGWLLPLEPGKLYYADTFEIPSGSRVEAPDTRWWGFVDVNVHTEEPEMWLHASTNARSVDLFAPAPKQDRANARQSAFESDTVSLTLAARISGDPNLRWLFTIASFLLVLIGLGAQAYSLRRTTS